VNATGGSDAFAHAEDAAPRSERRRTFLWMWVLVVVLYFAWEATAYRGLFAWLAEWQFVHLGQDLPTLNFGALTTIFAWPALHLFRRRVQREERDDRSTKTQALDADTIDIPAARRDAEAAEDAARDYMHFLFGFTTAMVLAAVVALSWTLLLPRLEGTPHAVQVEGALPDEGPARLVGTVTYGRIASFRRGILFLRRAALYAPVVPADGSMRDIRYFVEFLPSERADIRSNSTVTERRGILVRNDLPGALARLYHYLGYDPEPRYFVLYASSETIRWPYYMVALQFAIGALGFLACALFQRRHVSRLARDVRKLRVRERHLGLMRA
jgi:hypothetical protein